MHSQTHLQCKIFHEDLIQNMRGVPCLENRRSTARSPKALPLPSQARFRVSGESSEPTALRYRFQPRRAAENRSNAPTDGSAPAAGMSVATHITRIRTTIVRRCPIAGQKSLDGGPRSERGRNLPEERGRNLGEIHLALFCSRSHARGRSDGGCIVDCDW